MGISVELDTLVRVSKPPDIVWLIFENVGLPGDNIIFCLDDCCQKKSLVIFKTNERDHSQRA